MEGWGDMEVGGWNGDGERRGDYKRNTGETSKIKGHWGSMEN